MEFADKRRRRLSAAACTDPRSVILSYADAISDVSEHQRRARGRLFLQPGSDSATEEVLFEAYHKRALSSFN